MVLEIIKGNVLYDEYIRLSDILNNVFLSLMKNDDVLMYDKNENIIVLNGIINLLNDRYMCVLKESKKTIKKRDETVLQNPYNEIKNKIFVLCETVGFPSIIDLLYLGCFKDITYELVIDGIDVYEIINKIFVPLKIISSTEDKMCILEVNTIKYISLFDLECRIFIKTDGKIFEIYGFIKNETMNICLKTLEFTNNNLHKKLLDFMNIYTFINTRSKKTATVKFITMCNNNGIEDQAVIFSMWQNIQKLNIDFAKKYAEHVTIYDIITKNINTFVQNMNKEYEMTLEFNKTHLVKLVKTFTKEATINLHNMFTMIKLLLIGDDESVTIGTLLFNLLKDKKNHPSQNYISNIIYDRLHFTSQIKLKKTAFDQIAEIDKIKNINSLDIDLKQQVLLSKLMPEAVKKICLEKLDELKNSSNESYKIKLYVNLLIQYPWISDSDDIFFKNMFNEKEKEFLTSIENSLNAQIYGHKLAKNNILQMLAKIISVQGTNIYPIALCGPPGVGKTKFASCLASCLSIPFVQITLGGQNDGELLHGHGYTYSGAQPGLIVKKMVEAGQARCIMYFDELDKCVGRGGQSNELTSILIHLTDPMTNNKFQDRFFQEITFPLNKVIFIFSFNDKNKIDKILLDRMEILDINSYSINEKIEISDKFLLNENYKEVGFEKDLIYFSSEIIKFIIENYTLEPGVRALKRCLENILLKLNIDKIYSRNLFENIEYTKTNPLNITTTIVIDILGEKKYEYKLVHEKNQIGMINGLYATSDCSGGIVPIQMSSNNSFNKSFELKLTGNQKKIMKESVMYSFTSAINLLTEQGKQEFYNNYPNGIHIHTVEAATPKDGPSAGVAFTLGFLSLMLNLKIYNDVALTGEIDLYGNISKIGGIRYKIPGAFKANVKKVFVPSENMEDVEKLKKEMEDIFKNDFQIIYVNHVLQVCEIALINYETKKYLLKQDI